MGDFFQTIVDCEASENEAPKLGQKVSRWLIEQQIISAEKADNILSDTQLGYPPGPACHRVTSGQTEYLAGLLTNGLAIITNRTIFHAGQGGSDAVCATCSYRFEIGSDDWGTAVGQWYDDSGPGLLACPQCGATEAINHWQHDPPWGFGCLGFEFWNWPPLTETFIQQIADLLNHRIVFVCGKL